MERSRETSKPFQPVPGVDDFRGGARDLLRQYPANIFWSKSSYWLNRCVVGGRVWDEAPFSRRAMGNADRSILVFGKS